MSICNPFREEGSNLLLPVSVSTRYNMKILSQNVGNPVGDGNNTDSGERRNAPAPQGDSYSVELVPGVGNPVGCSLNTDKGSHQTPLPMRPIPS
jgi:hypothetical protein